MTVSELGAIQDAVISNLNEKWLVGIIAFPTNSKVDVPVQDSLPRKHIYNDTLQKRLR